MVYRRLIVIVVLVLAALAAMPHQVAAQCVIQASLCTQTANAATVTAIIVTETANAATLTAQVATQTAVANTSTAANWTHVAIMSTQTAVALITPSATPIPYYRYEEITPDEWVRWDYYVSAGDILQGGLLILLVLSLWVFAALWFFGRRRKPDV